MEVVKTSRLALQKEETNKRGAESCLKPVERKERERERAKEMAEIEEAVEQGLSCSLEGWQRVFGQGRRVVGSE